jgi:hypothetical protein
VTVDEWLADRREAGLKIDPATAEVGWIYALTLDPYGVHGELPEELQQVGREYFARAPGTDIWVKFGDLPESTRGALWKRHMRQLSFPAGLDVKEWGAELTEAAHEVMMAINAALERDRSKLRAYLN